MTDRERIYALACALPPSKLRERIIEVCVRAEREQELRTATALPRLIGVPGRQPRQQRKRAA